MSSLICKNCGSVYEVTFTKTSVATQNSFNCQVCHQVDMFSSNEAKTWTLKLIVAMKRP